jgi:hypothetical protein
MCSEQAFGGAFFTSGDLFKNLGIMDEIMRRRLYFLVFEIFSWAKLGI